MTIDVELTPREQQLYDLLLGRGDVLWTEICESMGGPDSGDSRGQQQWLGPYVTRLNRRIEGQNLRVEPGDLKKTYRLVRT